MTDLIFLDIYLKINERTDMAYLFVLYKYMVGFIPQICKTKVLDCSAFFV